MYVEERKYGPKIKGIEAIHLPNVQLLESNGAIPVYYLEGGAEQIARLECVFPAGRKYEEKRAVAALCSSLIQEGTQSKSAEEVAELLDFYGFRFRCRNDLDYAYVSISCLSKYFDKAMELFFEIIRYPAFGKKELQVAQTTASDNLKIQLRHNEFVAYRLATEAIFGDTHKYGYNTESADFLSVGNDDLRTFYIENFKLENALVILSGHVTNQQIAALLKELPMRSLPKIKPKIGNAKVEFNGGETIEKKIENSFQTAIKIAKRTFPRGHKDFEGLYILISILGGYFGSRLMQSIREKHGYSYNVYASLELLEEDGYINISTDVGSEYTQDALAAIFLELELLKKELVPEEELKMVKSYLLGKVLREIDGPFNSAATLRSLLVTGGKLQDLPGFVDKIRSITAHELQDLAKRYFDKKSFTTVIVS